jgi:hypothetical protein
VHRHYFGATAQELAASTRRTVVAHLNPERFAIPVYRGTGRDQTLVGSGILLAVGTAKLFCTAAHVYDALNRTPLVLHGEGPRHQVTAQAYVTRIPDVGRHEDKFDLLIDRLGEDRSRWFKDDRFITLDAIDQNDLPDSTRLLYMFAGYPVTANPRRHTPTTPTLATYVDSPVGPEVYDHYGFVANMHLVTAFGAKRMWNESGEVVTPTKPNGISGGPVWRLGHMSDLDGGRHEPKIVGIGLEYRRDALVALRLSFVLETIRSLYPDLSADIPRSELIGVNVVTSP